MENNKFYQIGYEFGFKHGPVKRLRHLLALHNDNFIKMSADEIQGEISRAYVDVEEPLPEEFFGSLEMKNINFILLGYTEGKKKNIRNKSNKKYHEKIGFKSKSYKLHEDVIDAFAEACEKADVSMSSTLERLMMQFVEDVEEK